MTNAEARCNKSLRPRKPEGSLGRTAQDVHLDSHTAPELCRNQLSLLSCCLTSTEVRWPIRDGDRVGRGRESERLDRGNRPKKRPERPWTAARTMEVLRRCPLAIAQRLVHCAIALSTAVLDRVTKTISVATLLTNNLDNSKQKMSNLLSPAPPPYSWSLLVKSEGPAPPPSSKISWSFDLAWNPAETMMMMMSWCLMSSDVIWHIRDKLWPMPKHGSIKATYVRCMRV